jgi:hypothetical protein
MVKDAAISVRVEPSLKENLEQEAARQRMTLAGYVEQVLTVHSQPPLWALDGPEVTHTKKSGASIKLEVAAGWPVALITPAHAEKLAMELLDCVAAAKRLSQPQYDVYRNRDDQTLAIVNRGDMPKIIASARWQKLEPPGGVAADIAYDIQATGLVILKTALEYRPGDFIGGGIRRTAK